MLVSDFQIMKDLINKDNTELTKMLMEKREALRTFRFGIVGSKTRNLKEGRGIRKTIAQILTLMNKNK